MPDLLDEMRFGDALHKDEVELTDGCGLAVGSACSVDISHPHAFHTHLTHRTCASHASPTHPCMHPTCGPHGISHGIAHATSHATCHRYLAEVPRGADFDQFPHANAVKLAGILM